MWEGRAARAWVAARPQRRAPATPVPACSVTGYEHDSWARGMCLMHYRRVRRGTPTDTGVGKPAGYGTYGILTEEGGRIICRDRYGLPRTMALVCSDLSQRHSKKSRERGAIRSVEAVRDPVAASHARTKESMRSMVTSRLRSTELRLLDQP